MAKRHGENISLGEVLKEFIGNSKLKRGLEKVSAKDAWHQVMGDTISKYTTQVVLEQDILYVQLSSSVLREELSYGREKILQLLNEEIGSDMIKKLVLR